MKLRTFLEDAKLVESKDYFPDVDVLKLDPDRVDVYDIVSNLMPTLVRMAYVNLCHEKEKYERTHTDDEDEPFAFTVDELEDKLDDLISLVRDRFDDLTSRDKISYIDRVKSEFKEKLTGDEK
jgi:hypothetical protein